MQDFFTSLYPSAAQTMPGYQRAPQSGMGFAMQYPAGMVFILALAIYMIIIRDICLNKMSSQLQGMQAYPPTAYSQPT